MRVTLSLSTFALLVLPLATACTDAEIEDGANDDYVVDGKADSDGLREGTAEARAVLSLVNTATRAELRDEVGLGSTAVKNIGIYRDGPDQELGTADDLEFPTLAELDGVPYVGPVTFKRLRQYVHDHMLLESESVQLTEADAGRTITIDQGTTVQVTLAANATTGYSWRVKSTTRTLGYPEIEYHGPGTGGPVGAGGSTTLTWNTESPLDMTGSHAVSLVYARSVTGTPANTFKFTVNIR